MVFEAAVGLSYPHQMVVVNRGLTGKVAQLEAIVDPPEDHELTVSSNDTWITPSDSLDLR